jgi:hypothetical protein
MSLIVALPSTHPGGLEASPSDHFGQCDAYKSIGRARMMLDETRGEEK